MITYLVFAMARSGHHAIINWIGKNYPGCCTHYNNTVRGWEKKEFIPYSGKKVLYNNENKLEVLKSDSVINNFEDFDMNDWVDYNFPKFDCFENEVIPVILLRDPWNWIASSLKIGRYANKFLDTPIKKDDMGITRNCTRIELYKKQLREVLAYTNVTGDCRVIDINYNRWFDEPFYRRGKARELGLMENDSGIMDVTKWGSGSSFTKRRLNGEAQKMKVHERYKHYLDNKRYRRILKDKELNKLAEEYFGFNLLK